MGVGEWRLDDHVEQVDGERVRGCGGCSEIPKNRSDHFFGKLVEAAAGSKPRGQNGGWLSKGVFRNSKK